MSASGPRKYREVVTPSLATRAGGSLTMAILPGNEGRSNLIWKRALSPTTSLLRSEEHTSELQSLRHLVCRLLLGKKRATPFDYTTLLRSDSEFLRSSRSHLR